MYSKHLSTKEQFNAASVLLASLWPFIIYLTTMIHPMNSRSRKPSQAISADALGTDEFLQQLIL
jgi:hypothetical protein